MELSVFTMPLLVVQNSVINQYTSYTIQVFRYDLTIAADSDVFLYLSQSFSSLKLHENDPYTGIDIDNDFCPVAPDCSGTNLQYSALTFKIEGMFPT